LKLNDRYEGLPPEPDDVPMYIPYEDECTEPQLVLEAVKMEYEAYDKYISAKARLPNSDGVVQTAKVIGHKRDPDGSLIGHSHLNPIFDTSLY
jgi:hypothetical protein